MGRLRTIGWEIGLGQADLEGKANASNYSVNAAQIVSGGRTGSMLQMSFVGANEYAYTNLILLDASSVSANNTTTYYLRVYVNVPSTPSVTSNLFTLTNTTGKTFATAYMNASGVIGILDSVGTSHLGTGPAVSPNVWYRVEISWIQNAGTTITFTMRQNGTQTATYSTTPPAATGINTINFGAASSTAAFTARYDDLAFNDTNNNGQTSWAGDGTVALLLPNSDVFVSPSGWTNGAGTTTNIFDAINNTPPIGAATPTASSQAVNPGSTTYDTYLVGYPTPYSAGIGTSAPNSVQAVAVVGSGSSSVTNPQTQLIVPCGKNFDTLGGTTTGAAVGAWPLNWQALWGMGQAITTLPNVTPQVQMSLQFSGAACQVCFLGLYIDHSLVGPSAVSGIALYFRSNAANLTWNAPASGTLPITYSVYRGTTSGGETLLASGLATTFYTDNTCVPGTLYYYYVTAINTTGTSPQSNEVMGLAKSSILFLEPGGDNLPAAYAYAATGGNTSIVTTGPVGGPHTGTSCLKVGTGTGAASFLCSTSAPPLSGGGRVSVWFQYATLPSVNTPILGLGANGSAAGFEIVLTTTGKLGLVAAGSSETSPLATGATTVSASSWHRISVCFVASGASLTRLSTYIDGTPEAALTLTAATALNSAVADTLILGAQFLSNTFVCYFDDIYVDADVGLSDTGAIFVSNISPTSDSGTDTWTPYSPTRASGSHYLNVIDKSNTSGVLTRTTATEESYTLPAAPTTGAIQMGYMGWALGSQATGGDISFVASKTGNATTSITISPAVVAAGIPVLVFIHMTTNDGATITDGTANSYNERNNSSNIGASGATNSNMRIFDTANAAGTSSITVTFGGATSAVIGVFAAPTLLNNGSVVIIDSEASTSGLGGTRSIFHDISDASEGLVVVAYGQASTATMTFTSDMTQIGQYTNSGGPNSFVVGYKGISDTSTQTIGLSTSFSIDNWTAIEVIYHVNSGSGSTLPQVVVGGTNYPITMSQSAAVNGVLVNSPTYPSGSRGIGLVSSAFAATTTMTESGLLLAAIPPLVSLQAANFMVGTTGVSVSITCAAANWTPGTPGTPTFTLVTSTGTTIVSQSVQSKDQATVVINLASVIGPISILDSLNSVSYSLPIMGKHSF